MIRFLYFCLLRLHPPHFRRRFADEMLWIFDQPAQNRFRLLADAAASVLRQWLFRPEFREQRSAALAASQYSDVPVFRTLDDSLPRKSALINGGILSLAIFAAMTLAIGHSRGSRPFLFVGAHYPRAHGVSVDRSSIAEPQRAAEVRVGEQEDQFRTFALFYFKTILVLRALDMDRDLAISPAEIAVAPIRLLELDLNGDGALSAGECGHRVGERAAARLDPLFIRRTALLFMRLNPALAALDVDHNGEISAQEVRNSSEPLRGLDRNRDGRLTANELAPDPSAAQEAIRALSGRQGR